MISHVSHFASLVTGLCQLSTPRAAQRWRAIGAAVRFLEKKLRARVVVDSSIFSLGRAELAFHDNLARSLKAAGLITNYYRQPAAYRDEPPYFQYTVQMTNSHNNASGLSATDPAQALLSALAESLERSLWSSHEEYLEPVVHATETHIARRGQYIPVSSFIGFSSEQRSANPQFSFDAQTVLAWTRATSLLTDRNVYIPAQTVSPRFGPRRASPEPLIREQITTGLATWPTLAGARLRGMLEVIERDAYMITWLNQLSPQRLVPETVAHSSNELRRMLLRAARFGLRVHVLQAPTDAPTHAIMVVVEDVAKVPLGLRFALGVSAHWQIERATEHALLEAIRSRTTYRRMAERGGWDTTRSIDSVGHMERILYWGVPEHAARLQFLITKPETRYQPAEAWINDTETTHYQRLLDWCRAKSYDCCSVSLGKSKNNPTPWSVEMVVIPQLHPLHIHERHRHLDRRRMEAVSVAGRLTLPQTLFTAAPHPFV